MKQKRTISIIAIFLIAGVLILSSIHGETVTAAKLELNQKNLTMAVGTTHQLSVKNLTQKAKVTWNSSNKKRATVSKNGVVKAKTAGTVTIYSNVKQNGKKTRKLTCKITITKKENKEKTLIAYFTAPVVERSGQLDGISSASRTTNTKNYKGNTEYIAELISKETNADLFKIVPEKAYPNTYEKILQRAEKEQKNDERPAIKNKIKNISQYDTIYVGYPIWWSDMPQIMYTFFDTYDLIGKRIIPFCTHGGSGLSDSVKNIKMLEPQTVVYKGLAIYRTYTTSSYSKVKLWIDKKEK